jgi:hypothetical protein
MSSEGDCKACGRYIGPIRVCPYCDADQPAKPALQLLKTITLVLAVFGLAALYLAATHRQPPVVAIDTITPSMNFAFVRIEGEVVGRPFIRVDTDSSKVSFVLQGPAGTLIRAVAYDETARAIKARGISLRRGQHVTVSGSLNIAAGRTPKLYIRDVASMTIRPHPTSAQRRPAPAAPVPQPAGTPGGPA